jgi:hypothetical protein
VVTALRQVRLVLDDPQLGLAFELTYRARFRPVPTDPNRIERKREILTGYMTFAREETA